MDAIAPAPASPQAPAGTLAETTAILERRVEEQAQTKVETAQRFPVRISGMALFNASYGTRNAGGLDTTVVAAPTAGSAVAGGTLRQSILGLEFHGPTSVLGGKVRGSMFIDFYEGFVEPSYSYPRLRTATLEIEWGSRSLAFGFEKPIFNPREPTSLSQVGISPLAGAGNLWRWQPQIRFEQRLKLGPATTLRAQTGVVQTVEDLANTPDYAASTLNRRRPGLQGRFELAHRIDDARRVEFAPGFHFSTTHIAGVSVPSRVASFDWFANPWARLELSGVFFTGQNVGHFGGLRQGFTLSTTSRPVPIHARGGWGQAALRVAPRLTFNVFGGIHDDRDSDLRYSRTLVAQNRIGAVNFMYRIAPNVIWSLEALQIRTLYLSQGNRIQNRYDMALAYQF
ncbi:MAG TPA: hypothetical protein DEH78_31035 [Solibacterales bacterium]|nr:hypothetical protein [Bryobacterales bacterium]